MSENETLRQLLDRWRAGDQNAATDIYQRYEQRAQRYIERKLGSYLGHHVDAEDVMIEGMQSFIRIAGKQSATLDRNGSLWGLVATVVRHKLGHAIEFVLGPKHDIRRQGPLQAGDSKDDLHEPADRQLTPDELAEASDNLEIISNALEPESFAIFILKLEGHSNSEIGEQLGLSRQGILRKWKRIESFIDRLLGDEDDEPGEEKK